MNTNDPKTLTDAEWRERLTAEQFHILREAGTERAFTGKYDKFYEQGEYMCAACGTRLFISAAKYNSGCGWPAFTKASDESAVEERRDISHGMIRTEVLCGKCGSHLGHVFPDGPPEEGGLRYCINSAALDFVDDEGADGE
ncbi:MAG: peptide-methionine (R)-S-oxide reductase MsrB [Pseudomonadota bacterium]